MPKAVSPPPAQPVQVAVKERYGLRWDGRLHDLTIELVCFEHGGTEKYPDGRENKAGCSKAEHFRNICEIYWGKDSPFHFQWNPWTDSMLEEACVQKWLALNGCASCVAGHTRILNPITGEQPTIKELHDKGIAPIVMTMNGPAHATVPFIKGFTDLYEVVLSNGEKFTSTANHLVLTEKGFVPVSSLVSGAYICGYDSPSVASRPQSTLDTGLLVQLQGADRWRKTIQDSQSGCPPCSCFDDEQLLLGQDNVQYVSPSQDDAQKHKECVFSCEDGREHKPQRSHPFQYACHPSISDTFPLSRLPGNDESLRSFLETISRYSPSFQQLSQFEQANTGESSSQESPHDSFHKPWPGALERHTLEGNSPPEYYKGQSDGLSSRTSRLFHTAQKSKPCAFQEYRSRSCLNYKVEPVAVSSVSWSGKAEFYDLQVPDHHHYFAEGAVHHNSGKSKFMAAWGLVNWMCDPVNTMVLVTSTSLGEARRRIWSDIIQLYNAANTVAKKKKIPGLPGKLADSIGVIRTWDGRMKYPDKCGIALIAGDKAKEQENIGKIIGIKNKRVFFLCDEMPELSPALVEAAQTNLITNYDSTQTYQSFQFIGSGNFKSIYDPFGTFCAPAGGWQTITLDSARWLTKNGVCLRFDGLASPNLADGVRRYPGIYSQDTLDEQRKSLGEHSSGFWRMCRAYPCPEGTSDRIFSEADFVKGNAHALTKWTKEPIKVASLDPAFSTGGDDALATFGLYGESTEGGYKLQITEQKVLVDDIRITDQNKSVQVARQFSKICLDRGIEPQNTAYDMTGGGSVFGGLLSEIWSSRPLGVQFGGSPSDRVVKDNKRADDLYSNRVTELWYAMLELTLSSQIRGLPPQAAAEFKERKYTSAKGAVGLKVTVEPKKEMRTRTSKSPDCFVAGTMVLTDKGERPIETISVGDWILTPFGYSPVFVIHKTHTTKLFSATLPNSRKLIGKGSHKVFTWNGGWKNLSDLTVDTKLEMNKNYWKWKLLNSLFTEVGNIGFAKLADTIVPQSSTMEYRKSFFTGLCGTTRLGLFLKASISITKIITRWTTELTISLWSTNPNTQDTTGSNVLKTRNFLKKQYLSLLQVAIDGEGLKKESTSCTKTEKGASPSKQKLKDTVYVAVNHSFLTEQKCAQKYALAEPRTSKGQKPKSAWFVAVSLALTGRTQKPVPLSVEELNLQEPCEVFNLTLEEHNAYYANGILVQNCADSAVILIELCRERFGWKITGMEGKKVERRANIRDKMLKTNAFYAQEQFQDVE